MGRNLMSSKDNRLMRAYRTNREGFLEVLETARHESSIGRQHLKNQLGGLALSPNAANGLGDSVGLAVLSLMGILSLTAVSVGAHAVACGGAALTYPVACVSRRMGRDYAIECFYPIRNYGELRTRAIADGRITDI